MRAPGAKGAPIRAIAASLALANLSWISDANAQDSPCPPVAEAIETYNLWDFRQAHDATTMTYELFEGEALLQRMRESTDYKERDAMLVDAMRQELAAIEPTLPGAMTESISEIASNVGVDLSRVDIDNDGVPELWLETVSGSLRCENHWFYRASPPHDLIAFFGTLPMGEAQCGYTLDVIAIDGVNYAMMTEEIGFVPRISMLTWQAPMQFQSNCTIQWKASDNFETETVCTPGDQPVCDRVAELAPDLTKDEPAVLAEGRVIDLAAIHIDGERDGHLSEAGFGEYADVDNDGDEDTFVGTYSEEFRGGHPVTYFSFSLIRWIDGGYRVSSGYTMQSWFGSYSTGFGRAAYPVIFDGRTYIVLRRHWQRDDPGKPGGYTLEIMEVANDESRLVGTVSALPILYVFIERPTDAPYFVRPQ